MIMRKYKGMGAVIIVISAIIGMGIFIAVVLYAISLLFGMVK